MMPEGWRCGLKRFFVVLTAWAVLECAAMPGGVAEAGTPTAEGGKRLVVVASLFPQFDFARAIARDRADVTLLLPPGTESHTFDPSPAVMRRIARADLFVYTGKYMEPWAERVVRSVADDTAVLDASEGIALVREAHDHDHDHAEGEHDAHGGYDPHIWLDPRQAMKMADNIERALIALDPDGAAGYRENAARLTAELQRLDDDTTHVVRTAARDTLVFGGRFAYRYFLERYGLHYVTAYRSCSVEAEPGIRDVVAVTRYIREHGISCIYHEEFADPKVARAIAGETGAELLLFSTGHNVTKTELDAGVTFVDIMRRNLENVKKGLN